MHAILALYQTCIVLYAHIVFVTGSGCYVQVPASDCRVVVNTNETSQFGTGGCAKDPLRPYPYCCKWDFCIPDSSNNTLGGICYDDYRTMACCKTNPRLSRNEIGISVDHCSVSDRACTGTDFPVCCAKDRCIVKNSAVCNITSFWKSQGCCSLF